jgi:hypothetical protein
MQISALSLIANRRNCKSEVSALTYVYTLLSEFCEQNQSAADCIFFRLQTYTFWNLLHLCTGITLCTNLATQSEFCRSERRRSSNCATFKHLRVFSCDVWRVDTISILFRYGSCSARLSRSRNFSDKQLVLRKTVDLVFLFRFVERVLLNYRVRTRTSSRLTRDIFVSRNTVRQNVNLEMHTGTYYFVGHVCFIPHNRLCGVITVRGPE